MAAYNTIVYTPEEGLEELWTWESDLQTSYDGSESSDPLRRYPKRRFKGTMQFDETAELRRQLAMMLVGYKTPFYFALHHYGTKLKAAASPGNTSVTVNALRTNLRVGEYAVITDGSTYETPTVASVTETTVTFELGLANAYPKGAVLCPLVQVYNGPTAQAERRGADNGGTVQFEFLEYSPQIPFVDPLNPESLTTFTTLPVLEEIPYGSTFSQALNTGAMVEEFLGLPALADVWDQSKWTFEMTFICNRTLDINSWHRWVLFADTVRGSDGTFLLPSNREDLNVVTPVAGSGTQVTVEGHEYVDHYYPLDTFKRIAVTSDAGVHYATVTGVTNVSGNDRLTFTPAVPAGAGWTSNQKVSFLLKLRIADDKMLARHFNGHSEVVLAVRTVS